MDDYIDRKSTIEAIQKFLEIDARNACLDLSVCDPEFSRCMARYNGIKAVRRLVQERPSAKVREDIKAKWSHLGGDEWCCTACGNVIHTEGSWEKPTKKFCDECGADMREEQNETDLV